MQRRQSEIAVILQKLQLAETKQRFAEQMNRDENGMSRHVSRAEYDELQKECANLHEKLDTSEAECSARGTKIQQLQKRKSR